jgi:hypothetical protein
MLQERIGDRSDSPQLVKTIEEFFVFASDFVRHKAVNTYPRGYISSSLNEHFLLTRETASYLFVVDNFSDNNTYFERTVFKIFLKSSSASDAIMTLFLVPQSCDEP